MSSLPRSPKQPRRHDWPSSEAHAADLTRLTLETAGRRHHSHLRSAFPTRSGTRFATYLEAYANPHVFTDETRGRTGRRPVHPDALSQADGTGPGSVPRDDRPGRACRSTAAMPPPWIVTMPLASLAGRPRSRRPDRRRTGPHGQVRGDGEITGDRITAGQARRLACTSEDRPRRPGRREPAPRSRARRRLFRPTQRKALRLRDRNCRAEGCDIPGAWCEIHHRGDPGTRAEAPTSTTVSGSAAGTTTASTTTTTHRMARQRRRQVPPTHVEPARPVCSIGGGFSWR